MNFFRFRKLKKEIVPILNSGGVGILPTDTLYGIVGSALNAETVERIYALRKRDLKKPMIILLASLDVLLSFDIKTSCKQQKILQKVWPGKVSIVLRCDSEKFAYLHRKNQSLAFRVPAEKWLRKMLQLSGPLVAPSANLQSTAPAETIEEAKKYFGDSVDFYFDAGTLVSKPSTIIKIGQDGEMEILRRGAVKL